MVSVKEASAKKIKDSRGENTIEVFIETNAGKFSASAPTGKSTGKFEAKPYKKSLDEDIKKVKDFSEYFSSESIDKFEDLRRIEDILEGNVGANTVIAFEFALLKAMAREQKKEVWQIINPQSKKLPRFVGNVIGGGKHNNNDMRPDFQEFLVIPNEGSAKANFEKMKEIKKDLIKLLKEKDLRFSGKKTDEDAWACSLSEKEILEILKTFNVPLGIDIAASSFYKRNKYNYLNPPIKRETSEQEVYLNNLIKNFNIFYVEDPFEEEDFKCFSKILEKNRALIVGDDLIVTNEKRLKKAIEEKSVNAIIVKPNQNGSLVKVKEVCELAKKNNIKLVFSHRSGETEENILADLAVGFGADFLKCGVTGPERESKIKRIIEIENSLK